MNDILNMLHKKKEHCLQAKENYSIELSKLPKGSIRIHSSKSSEYYELQYYDIESKKCLIKYIGKDKTEIQEQLDKRAQIKEELQFIEYDLRAINKMLKIAEKQIGNLDIREKLRKVRAGKSADNIDTPVAPQTHTINDPLHKPPQ